MAQEHSRVCHEEDSYEVLRRIGSGAFAQVYLVLHKLTGRQCVMKEVTSFTTMAADKKESTELEVRLLSSLHHPNIVGYQDSFVNKDGHLCIFMEYCKHGDVHSFMQLARRSGKTSPSEPQALDWLVQISLALQVLHDKRILHRDLKTQNVFLSGCRTSSPHQEFAVKLGDLGVAKVLGSDIDLAMTQIGTPIYMSPELFNGKPYGYKSDMWGLGCVLFEMINHQQAFEAQSINALALKIVKGRYTPITSSCSEDVKSLIKALLSINPTQRPEIQDLLQVPAVLRRVPSAVQAAIGSCESPMAKAAAERILLQQLALLNLSTKAPIEGAEETALPLRHGRRLSLQQRLERAERRKRREEETLRRLQETASMLEQYLKPSRSSISLLEEDPPSPRGPPRIERHLGSLRPNDFREGRPSPAPPLSLARIHSCHSVAAPHSIRTEASCLDFDDDSPAMSHRDKVLLRKERRKEEEQQRFEAEARKIREENLAYQRAWVLGSKDVAGRSRPPFLPSQPSHPLKQVSDHVAENKHSLIPVRRRKVLETLPRPEETRYDFDLPSQVTSARLKTAELPRPPMVHYADPAPPQDGQIVKRRGVHGLRAGGVRRSRSLRGISLEALSDRRFPMEQSEDSDCSVSCSELGSEVGFSGDDGHLRLEAQTVQQRIDRCKAAILRHKSTMDMLQDELPAEAHLDRCKLSPRLLNGAKSYQGLPFGRVRSEPSQPPERKSSVPAIIQDRVARLTRQCVEGLGLELFQLSRDRWHALCKSNSSRDTSYARGLMVDVLGLDRIGFLSLIDQIVHMELQHGLSQTTQADPWYKGALPPANRNGPVWVPRKLTIEEDEWF